MFLTTETFFNGRKDRIRTDDPYVPNVVLYQAEPPSDGAYYIKSTLKTQDFYALKNNNPNTIGANHFKTK